jgi:hypothetical protein
MTRKTKKPARQRAVITLTDDPTAEHGFIADLTCEPSVEGRTENSPCCNAALRLAKIILAGKAMLSRPIPHPLDASSDAPSTATNDNPTPQAHE